MIKALAVSDQVVERLYALAQNGHFQDVDILLGCGDLPYNYLEYFLSLLNVPLLYVPGNHDPVYDISNPMSQAEGGSNLDIRPVNVKGMLFAGLGGSIRYRPDGVNQYTQGQAFYRAYSVIAQVLLAQIKHNCKLDILLSHSPPFGIHDDDSTSHQGLRALNLLMRILHPRYLLHGHTHFFRNNLESATTQVGDTTVMNVFPYKIIEFETA